MNQRLAGTAAAVLLGSPLASQILPMRFSDLVRQSEAVVVGTVSKSVSRLENGGRTIRTYVTLTDLLPVRGQIAERVLTLRFEGGTVGASDTARVPKRTTQLQRLASCRDGTTAWALIGYPEKMEALDRGDPTAHCLEEVVPWGDNSARHGVGAPRDVKI